MRNVILMLVLQTEDDSFKAPRLTELTRASDAIYVYDALVARHTLKS